MTDKPVTAVSADASPTHGEMAYIGRKTCGCVVAFVLDDTQHPKDTAKDVAEFIGHSLMIERVSMDYCRTQIVLKCDHEKIDGGAQCQR